jgi:hypothetical protein
MVERIDFHVGYDWSNGGAPFVEETVHEHGTYIRFSDYEAALARAEANAGEPVATEYWLRSKPGRKFLAHGVRVPDEKFDCRLLAYTHPAPQPSGPVGALEDKREEMLATVTPPDNAPASAVLAYVLYCASMWEPEARIIGNARAGDIVRAISALTAGKPEQVPSGWQEAYVKGMYEAARLVDLDAAQLEAGKLTVNATGMRMLAGYIRQRAGASPAAPTAGGGDA